MKILLKHVVSVLSILFFVMSSTGQINYAELSFSQALEKAKSSRQLVFVQMEGNCVKCNEVADKGLSNEQVCQIYDKFICVKVIAGTSEYEEVCRKYRICPIYPTSLILDRSGNFLGMMYDKSTTFYVEYINLAAHAMSIKDNPPIVKYVDRYSTGKYDLEFLRQYIGKLNEYRFETDDLLDEYIGKLTVDSLFSVHIIDFIIHSTPMVDSWARKLAQFENSLFDTVFMALPLKERIALNNMVIAKSRKKAFRDKDEQYMRKVASFVRGTYGNRKKSTRAYSNNMLDFYNEVKDTAKYIQNAENYYKWHLEKLDIDSISRAEKEDFIKMKDGRIMKSGRLLIVGNQVNKMAWSIYELTDDPEHLGMALKWTERILVYENPVYHDTYAHILYKLGAEEKAIEWQGKAIGISARTHRPTDGLEVELEKMRTDGF